MLSSRLSCPQELTASTDTACTMKKIITFLTIVLLIISCSSGQNRSDGEAQFKDTNGFDILIGQLANNIENLWGMNEVLIAGPKDYVKYTDQYKTRSHINFDTGIITVETIAKYNPISNLQHAIVSTLLMSNDPKSIDLYSDAADIPTSTEPFLYGQVLNNNGDPIFCPWSATSFAEHLIRTSLKARSSGSHYIWYVTIQLVPNHVDKRAHKYLSIVRKASRQYGVDPSLILAIMQTESSFNPYAVSHSDALGLMQVVQHSAGRDVFKMKGRDGQPSRRYLFDPENNIDAGTAYLSLLQNTYLGSIIDHTSRRYAVIAAYNGGVGNVLRVFSRDQNIAFKMINAMRPSDVYQMIYIRHPSVESRRYLYKVSSLQKTIYINS